MIKTVNFNELEKFTRSCITNELIKDIYKQDPCSEKEEVEGTIILFNYKIDYEYTQCFDEEANEFNHKTEYIIKEYDIEELLKQAKIEFKTSSISESVYINLKNKRYRFSTHDRPSIYDEFGNYLYDHECEYDNNIICNNEVEMYKKIKQLLKI